MKWLRESKYAAAFLVLVRLYVGWKWLTSGWHKVTGDQAFDASGFVKGAIAKPVLENGTSHPLYPSYLAFLKHTALPNIDLFSFLVSWGELLVGVALIVGLFTSVAAFFGLFMNFTYLFAGAVSLNPLLLLLGFLLLLAGKNAGKIGLDFAALPALRKLTSASLRNGDKSDKPS